MSTSRGLPWRLLFSVNYTVQGSDEVKTEQFCSNPFIVYSNKGSKTK
jgi:hypothetical protein